MKVKTTIGRVPQGFGQAYCETGFLRLQARQGAGPPRRKMAHDSATRRKLMQMVE